MKPLAVLLLLTAAAAADDLLPQAFPKDRYAATLGKSPFVLETKVVEQAVAPENPFQNLYLRSISKADGKDYVIIQRLGEERPMKPFIGNEPDAEGYTVTAVRIGNSFRETKVVLQKGSNVGEIPFKEDSNTPPPPANPARNPGMPGAFPKPVNTAMPQSPAIRTLQVTPPSQPIPRPNTPNAVPMPPQNIPQIPGGSPRARLRTIPNN
ncbi:MAG: hypothetical protein ABIP20_05505 [Chthoniobacteraceae bacterium]